MSGKKRVNVRTFKFWAFLFGLISVIAAGTAGFTAVENLSLADAFYFSVVTVTTVGFGEPSPGSQPGKDEGASKQRR